MEGNTLATFILSKRHEEIIKESQVVDSGMSAILSRLSPSELKRRPFEIIFGTLGPMLMPGFLWKIFATYAELSGFGPGLIGRFIDNALGFGSGEGPKDVSDSKVKNITQAIVNKLELNEQSADDFNKYAAGITKKDLERYWGSSKKMTTKRYLLNALKLERANPFNLIYAIIKTFLKGVLLAGTVAAGISFLTGKSKEDKLIPREKAEKTPSTQQEKVKQKVELKEEEKLDNILKQLGVYYE